jgi:hypothetical protein
VTRLRDCELSARVLHVLENAGYQSIEAVWEANKWELMRLPNFGRVSFKEVMALRPKLEDPRVTEKEACLRWCPYRARVGNNRVSDENENCFGSRCMMWRWNPRLVRPGTERTGYCGLAGVNGQE